MQKGSPASYRVCHIIKMQYKDNDAVNRVTAMDPSQAIVYERCFEEVT